MNFPKFASLIGRPGIRAKLLCAVTGAIVGILLWNGFILSLEATSTTEFCVSCHSMQSFVYPRYQQSVHYRNSKGIQAGCADCHIPKPLAAKLIRKTIGLKDVYHTVLGTVDSPEKFAAKKPLLAERVRERMRARDSKECRNCHRPEQMDLARQDIVARKQHQDAERNHKTCIDCHQGVGHPSTKPVDKDSADEESFSLD